MGVFNLTDAGLRAQRKKTFLTYNLLLAAYALVVTYLSFAYPEDRGQYLFAAGSTLFISLASVFFARKNFERTVRLSMLIQGLLASSYVFTSDSASSSSMEILLLVLITQSTVVGLAVNRKWMLAFFTTGAILMIVDPILEGFIGGDRAYAEVEPLEATILIISYGAILVGVVFASLVFLHQTMGAFHTELSLREKREKELEEAQEEVKSLNNKLAGQLSTAEQSTQALGNYAFKYADEVRYPLQQLTQSLERLEALEDEEGSEEERELIRKEARKLEVILNNLELRLTS